MIFRGKPIWADQLIFGLGRGFGWELTFVKRFENVKLCAWNVENTPDLSFVMVSCNLTKLYQRNEFILFISRFAP